MILLNNQAYIAGYNGMCLDDDPRVMSQSPELNIESMTNSLIIGSMNGTMYKSAGQSMAESNAELSFQAKILDLDRLGLLGKLTNGPIDNDSAAALGVIIANLGLSQACDVTED